MAERGSFVNGVWIEQGDILETINPSTGMKLAEVPMADVELLREALRSARNAFRAWSKLELPARLAYLRNLKNVLMADMADVARVIALEQGKPYTEALLVEILPSIDALDFYMAKAEKYLGPLRVNHWQVLFKHKKASYVFEPLGVAAVISPWNYPFVIPFLDAVAALVAGNTVVFKPSSITPLVGIKLAELFDKAGFPGGVFNMVIGKSNIGRAMVEAEETDVIMFTGSVETGKYIYEKAAGGVKKLILELGGKDAAVVMPDANLQRAVNGIVWGSLMNSGQTCASIERVYVHEAIYERFLEMLVEATSRLKQGDPMSPETDIGPMTTMAQRNLVMSHVQDAVDKGAEVVYGGKTSETGFFIKPTVIVGVNHSMTLMRDETFGPVIPIMKFSSLEDAIALANDSRYGLTASIWTADHATAEKFAAEVRAGTVTINDHVFSFGEPEGAWGGVRFSGIGRTHGMFGLLELVNIKFVSRDYGSLSSQLWWYPYDSELRNIAELASTAMFDDNHVRKIGATLRLMKRFKRLIKTVGIKNLVLNIKKFI